MSKTLVATELLVALLTQASTITSFLHQAQAAGRDLSDSEWDAILKNNDAERQRLKDAIDAARRK